VTKHIIPTFFAFLATWVIFTATPFFRLNGLYPQVDTQIIYLHSVCGLMFIYFSGKLVFNKYELKHLNHPLIIIPFALAILGIVSSLFAKSLNGSLAGSLQVGQGVFWYFDLTIILIVFSQVSQIRFSRVLLFVNLMIITFIVSFFTFFPHWKGIPVSFYYFTDYLCFYGVLSFILFTTLTKKTYLNILAFIILGFYISILENRAAMLFWGTTLIAGITYYILNSVNISFKNKNISKVLFSDSMFVFLVFFLSLLMLFSSLYFWSSDFNLPKNIKDTLLDAPVVRGKIIENSLYSLDNFKNLLIGNGWGNTPSLLLENMNSWQYDELRLGYNLHFHTHNELVEHIISLGIFGGLLFLIFIFYIFRASKSFSFESKLGWFLFFKITCFWFLWTGTFTLFAVVLSCFIITKTRQNKYFIFLNQNSRTKNNIFALMFLFIGLFLFYGAYITYASTKTNSMLKYSKIINGKNDSNSKNKECLAFYDNFNRGGLVLDRFLHGYSSHLFTLDIENVDDNALYVFYQLQCKANNIIKEGIASSSLLNTSMQADTNFYYKFGKTQLGINYIEKNYNNWLEKALMMSKDMPNRGDLIMPFLSYAINSNKSEDAVKICKKSVKGIEAMCDLISANEILAYNNIGKEEIKKAIFLINKAINKGIFNEIVYGFWFNQEERIFEFWGLKGIPLSPDILFLISNKEKKQLEQLIQQSYE
tara:strand:- start:12034 stop:14148 length:2115 start_codon:yes stop_codon:yes gene_type:complete